MSGTPLILSIVIALIFFVVFMLVVNLTTRQDNVRQRVRKIADENNSLQAQTIANAAEDYRLDQDMTFMGKLLEAGLSLIGINVEAFRKESQMTFYRAGISSPNAAVYYLFMKRVGVVVFLLIALYIFLQPAVGTQKLLHWVLAALIAFLGVLGPDGYIKNSTLKRRKVLERSFPDALDLLLVCVESGLALDGALARVCRELGRARPEITQELNRTRLELTLLNDRGQALNNLAERTDMVPFRSLVSTLIQSERFGTSLTETLRVLSEDYRNTRLMLAEEKAGRLPTLMTIPLITLMMPALFLVIMGPAILKVTHMTSQ